MSDSHRATVKSALLPLILIVSLFFMWGVANNLNDILITQFKKAFVLSDFQAGLVQSAFYLGYFVFAIPAGLFMQRFGYKAAVVVGLAGYAVGAWLFYPAASAHSYVFFLTALFVIASGLAFLEAVALGTERLPRQRIACCTAALSGDRRDCRLLGCANCFNPLSDHSG